VPVDGAPHGAVAPPWLITQRGDVAVTEITFSAPHRQGLIDLPLTWRRSVPLACPIRQGNAVAPEISRQQLPNPTDVIAPQVALAIAGRRRASCSQAENAGPIPATGGIHGAGVDARPRAGEDRPLVTPDRRSEEMVHLVEATFGPRRRAQAVAGQLIGLPAKRWGA
jgi:hypothetical protein